MSKVFDGLSFDASKPVKENEQIDLLAEMTKENEQIFRKWLAEMKTEKAIEAREPEKPEKKSSKKNNSAKANKNTPSFDGPKYPNGGNRGPVSSYGFDEHEQYVSSDEPDFE